MKTPFVVPLLLLALAAPGWCQEAPNPFVKQPGTKAPEPPAGASFASVVEHVLVPPDLLDDWLREHPLKEDATALRAAVQGWVVEGKAKLDHAALNLGTAGRKTTNATILEKMYPTEFGPGGAGAWPWPTSFDTRNLGHDMQTGVATVAGVPSLWTGMEYCEMTSSESYQQLIERTRQPTDLFLPRFRAMRLSQRDPNVDEAAADPFAEPIRGKSMMNYNDPHGLVFKPDLMQLAGRFDPVFDENPDNNLSRLIFYRGSIAPPQKVNPTKAADVSRMSFRMIRVSLLTFSSWLQSRSPLAATTEAFEAAEGWRKEGKADSIGELSTQARAGTKSVLENIEEYIYPTEYMPGNDSEVIEQWEEGKKKDGKDGVATFKRMKITPRPGLDGAGLACAFDTRNLGNSIEATLSNDDQGLILSCNWVRVLHIANPVYHRVKVDDEWIPDVTMPLFSANMITSDARLQPGQWTLLGETSEFLKTEIVDRDHCLLVFVKVE